MSAHTRRKAQRKYKQRHLLERESNRQSISNAMSVTGRVRRLRKRRKLDAARGERQRGHRPMLNKISKGY